MTRTLDSQNNQLDLVPLPDPFPDSYYSRRSKRDAANDRRNIDDTLDRQVTSEGMRNGYYQPCSMAEYEHRVDVIRSKVEAGQAASIRLSEFQDWAELDWIKPQGTFETGQKLGEKTLEEAQEYYDEILPMQSRALRRKPNKNTNPGINEAGDYLWMLAAMASNSGIDLESALRAKFGIDSQQPVTLGDVHEVASRGISWLPLRVDNPTQVGSPESDVTDLDPYIWLRLHPIQLYRDMYHLYGKGETDQKPTDAPEDLRLKAADWHGDALLFLAYYVHHWTYSSLPEVAATSFNKITDRVAHGTVDKDLGNR